MKHPFVKSQDGWMVTFKNEYRADRRIFLAVSALVIILGLVGWGVDGFRNEQHVYVHCPLEALGGKCKNPLYGTCKESYCSEEYWFAGYTYGEKTEWTVLQKVCVWLMILLPVGAILYNHFRHNKDFKVEDDE